MGNSTPSGKTPLELAPTEAVLPAGASASGDSEEVFPVGTVLKGEYIIERWFDRGGFGQVCEARQLGVERTVAIKVMHPQGGATPGSATVERFSREARLAAKITHPHVTTIFSYGIASHGGRDHPFLVMELLRGQVLGKVMGEPLPIARVIAIARQVAAALIAVHKVGIIHRDLKPANIFLTDGPEGERDFVKLLDFGISKDTGESGVNLTQGLIFGTPAYMAPEHMMGSKPHPGFDVYALAVIIYEMIAGQVPFPGEGPTEILQAKTTGKDGDERPVPQSLIELRPEVPAELWEVIRKALAAKPRERYASMVEFREALLQAMGQGSGVLASVTPTPAPAVSSPTAVHTLGQATTSEPRSARRVNRLGLVAVGIAVIAGFALGMAFLRRSGQEQTTANAPTQSAPAKSAPTTTVNAPTPSPAPTRVGAPSPQGRGKGEGNARKPSTPRLTAVTPATSVGVAPVAPQAITPTPTPVVVASPGTPAAVAPTPSPVAPVAVQPEAVVPVVPAPPEPVREAPKVERPAQEHPETDRGYDFLRLRRLNDARQAFETALAKGEKPKGNAYAGLARVMFAQNRFPEAEDNARKALAGNGGEAARMILGNALLELGKYEEAVSQYDQVLKGDPGNREAQRQRLRALRMLGRSQ